jgi:DNA modification methylase
MPKTETQPARPSPWPADQVERRPVADLLPYARNARTHSDEQVAQLAASIREWGWTIPLLVDESGTLIAGHGRLLAAQRLGLESVPVMVASGWSEAKRRAYAIADNRLPLSAGWDDAMLALELSALRIEDFDLGLMGFDQGELDGLLDGLGLEKERTEDDTEPQIDLAEELREQWGVETGQLWQLGEHRLLCGDSTKAEDVARLLGDDRPHLMVTDPPYGVEYDPTWRTKAAAEGKIGFGTKRQGKVLNDDIVDWTDVYSLFNGDVAYVWHASLVGLEVASNLATAGFELRSQIIWAKESFSISRGHYHWQHESCFYAVKKGSTGHWAGDHFQTTLWKIKKNDGNDQKTHGTQKPLECMARPIRNNSEPGDLVYEPFSGSGTTIIACENLNRRCLAIEISPAYCAVALQRWADHTGLTPVLCQV